MSWIATLLAFNPFVDRSTPLCQQWDSLHPSRHAHVATELDLFYASPEFKHNAYRNLEGAVEFRTVFDEDSGPVVEEFIGLHGYLRDTFPRVYDRLNVTEINTYGLVFHWQGSTDAKPFLSAAHQDVVPVNPSTLSEWVHPPYSGHYDGTWIWGRGTCDDKGDLIPKLTTIDALLEHGFSPSRSIVLAFGFDEESNGLHGGGHIATYLQDTYGRDGFAIIHDEGGYLTDQGNGVYFAQPALSEKGYVDVRIQVESPGGHSSIPPDHTSIGYLAQFITALEENPHDPRLLRDGTPFHNALCLAEYSPSFPNKLRRAARRAISSDAALNRLKRGLIELSPNFNAMLRTSQAADVVEGGVKVNALPERAAVIVNHRIAQHSSVAEVQEHIVQVLYPIACKHDLTLDAFGGVVHTGQAGTVSVSNEHDYALEPSPKTPIGHGPYSIFAGTIKATMESSNFYNVTQVIVGPSMFMANTDTRHYWNLTNHIFRFSPYTSADLYNGVHTINEAVRAEAVIEAIRFHTKLILNIDESSLP